MRMQIYICARYSCQISNSIAQYSVPPSSSPEIQALFRVYFLRELFFNTQNPLDEILQEKKQFLTKLTACSKRKVISYSIYRNFQSFSPMPIHDARLRAKSRMFWGTLMKLCPGSINVL